MQKRLTTKRLIIHHSASSKDTSVPTITQWHKDRGFATIGYHYVVSGATGEIHPGRGENLVGAHTKNNNSDSIGICLTGNYEVENVDNAGKEGLLLLLQHLMDVYELTWNSVSYHKTWGATSCPGKNLAIIIDEWKDKSKQT